MIIHEVIGLNNHDCMHIMFLTIIDDMTNQKNHDGIITGFMHFISLILIDDSTNLKSHRFE
jgi:hypothetical protein